MALKSPPTQDTVLEGGFFKDTWVKWFQSIKRENNSGFNGTFDIANGDTVTVVNGKITDVS